MSSSGETPNLLPSTAELYLIDDVDELFQQEADILAIDQRGAAENSGITLVGRVHEPISDTVGARIKVSRRFHCEDKPPTTIVILDYEIGEQPLLIAIGMFSPDPRGEGASMPGWIINNTDEEEIDTLRYFIRNAEWDAELTRREVERKPSENKSDPFST
jgi:hypothetical protein